MASLMSQKISPIFSASISLIKYPKVRYDGLSQFIRYMYRMFTL